MVGEMTCKLSDERKARYTLNDLIDYLIEMNDLDWIIKYLYENEDWTEKDFEEMQFDLNDVHRVLNEKEEDEE